MEYRTQVFNSLTLSNYFIKRYVICKHFYKDKRLFYLLPIHTTKDLLKLKTFAAVAYNSFNMPLSH